MKINNIKVVGKEFAYDNCHKIYILETEEDKREALLTGYNVFPIDILKDKYMDSCDLRFVNNWQLDKTYIGQFEEAVFQ